ncbi:PCMD domain-containing protein [Prevotella sp.]|uniref:PCMD domain-containing protein n=1 Tax=Prevotella sp. TaxID=59823 RepID=UPI003DA3CC55
MKLKFMTAISLLTLMTFTSCISEEALNSEADITSCEVDKNILIRDPVISNEKVTFYVKDSTDISQQSPKFSLTEGATISPESGTTRNFLTPQTYVVTSQDGKWKKTYNVEYTFSNLLTTYNFDNVKYYYETDYNTNETRPFYQIFYSDTPDGSSIEWGSGNAGFMITNYDGAANSYPTCQDDNGYIGKCAKLTTVSTGALGAMFKAPIAAGNLFIGSFQIDLSNAAKSTHFGVPFKNTPTELVGYYKYKAGDVYTDVNSNEVKGKKDNFDIYAILYEVTDDVQYLDGTNSLTSDNIISIARLQNKKETDTWTRFAIPFVMKDGKTIDADKLKNGKYNISIIMSSSIDGATFDGAVGSTLYVDEMQLFYK